MGIFRGTGGTGDSTTDTTVTTVTEKAAEAASSATSAANSATSAANSASSASTSEANAATSETNAATSATASATSATASETAKTAAQAAQTAAETAETNAETAEANAVTAKNQAVTAKDNAVTAQTAAETAETNAETAYANTLAIFGDAQDVQDAVDSASASATTATTKATEAATSATNAANSASSAGTSETNAASSASQAATSANTAGSHATDAETAKNAAETAQASAEAAETAAETAQVAAETAETNAASSATSASGSATSASTSAGTATTKAAEAATSATNAATSESNASTSASNAATSATAAQTAQTAAETAQAAAEAAQEAIDGLYLGTATSNPTVDLNGDPVTAGDWYFNTTDNTTRIYDGSAWNTVNPDLVGDSSPQLGGELDTNGNDISFGDNVKAKFGASDDLQIYHDGSDSIISDTGTGNLEVRANKFLVTNAGGTENIIFGRPNGAVSLYYDNAEKLATTSSGVDITGTVVADGLTVDGSTNAITLQSSAQNVRYKITDGTVEGRLGVDGGVDVYSGSVSAHPYRLRSNDTKRIEIASNGDISFYEDTGTTAKLTWDASAEELQFKDNVAAEFGDGGDLRIYHDGSNSYVSDQGTGNLKVLASTVQIMNALGDENALVVRQNAEVELYHNGSEKLTTTSTGIDVTGTVVADDEIIVDGASGAQVTIRDTGRNGLQLSQNNTGGGFIDLVDATENLHIRTQSTNNIRIQSSGDISFYDDAGSSQDFYWDASTSRLGLGTTSPSAVLDVNGIARATNVQATASVKIEANNPQFHLVESDGPTDENFNMRVTGGNFQIRKSNDALNSFTNRLQIDGGTGDLVIFADDGTSQDFYWDASASRLGLGTTSPQSDLHIAKSSPIIRMQDTDNDSYGMIMYNTSSGGLLLRSDHNEQTGTSGSNIIFQTDGSEAARIDSSGNLLVGKTATASTTVGAEIRPEGRIFGTTDDNFCLLLNRKTSDGTIVDLRKDGSTVGSIGVDNTDNLFISGNSTHSGLMVGSESIVPYSNGATTDATEDLGASSIRWRNLYLSGGVYLGGTGSANLLGDYEEGTFTPTFGGSTTDPSGVTYDQQTGTYTKVGTLVQVTVTLGTDAITSVGSGNLRIRGLPFNPNANRGAGRPTAYSFASNIEDYNIYVGNGYFDLLKGSPFGYAQTSVLGTGTNANRLWVTFSYETT